MIFASVEPSRRQLTHEYGDSFTGMLCGTMVMRDGGGDQCGRSYREHSKQPATHPVNTILVEFRKIKNKYGTVADSARWCLENGVWEPDSLLLGGANVTHAHRVLTRLAQWKDN